MQSWPSAQVPAVPGRGPELRLYDTSDRQVRPVAPGNRATMYVCGITPYDSTHLGHAATYLTFDLVHRMWLDLGHDVHYVQNVTDVDDPLFERAARDGVDWRDLADREIGPVPRRHDGAAGPPAARLCRRNRGHRRGDRARREDARLRGGLRRRRCRVPGRLLPRRRHRTVRLRVRLRPRHHAAAVRASAAATPTARARPTNSTRCYGAPQRPGEPSWPSPFGAGRPGWHVECAAIALSRIGTGLDIQGGGSDLIFPHHEFSAAHAECCHGGAAFRPALRARGDDRLGRAQDVQEPGQPGAGLAGCAPTASSRRRSGWVCWPATTAPTARGAPRCSTSTAPGCSAGAPRRRCRPDRTPPTSIARVRQYLADDLDTPKALAALDGWTTDALEYGGHDAEATKSVAAAIDALLGVDL